MKCYLRSFDVGIGDCNVIRIVNGDEQYVIMIDCGRYTKPLKEYLENTLNNHIDLLIATHIDSDHIQGITTMINEHDGLSINEIWYNSYKRAEGVELFDFNDQQKAILKYIQRELPVEFDAIKYREISASQGKTLARAILEKDNFRRAWKKEYITNQTADYNIPGGFGKIVFLAPTQDSLNVVNEKFKDAFDKFFMQTWQDGMKNGEEIQELLIRFVDAYKNKYQSKYISAQTPVNIDAEYVRMLAREENADKSDTNYSSIAFILECGDHKVAFLGDAFASTIINSIENKYGKLSCPLKCDAIKVSHHGSDGNNSKTLYEQIISHLYFIPGGKGEQYPTLGTIGRIADSHYDGYHKQFVFSHRCDSTEKINALKPEIKEELGIETIITDREYELFER